MQNFIAKFSANKTVDSILGALNTAVSQLDELNTQKAAEAAEHDEIAANAAATAVAARAEASRATAVRERIVALIS